MGDDPTRGLYHKYIVTRTDGSSKPGEKHDGCQYFVLDCTHDEFALPALRAYAEACKAKYPLLSADLMHQVDEMEAQGFVWTSRT